MAEVQLPDPLQQASNTPGSQPPEQPVPPGASPSTTNVPGLPPTALSQQLSSLNDEYAAQQESTLMGAQLANPLELEGAGAPAPTAGVAAGGGGAGGASGGSNYAESSLQDLAEQMAKGYGLDISRGSLVNDQGNFMQTPEQLAGAGGSMGDTAAKMNYIAQAINDQKVAGQQAKAIAALQTGLGQVQSRGRGSLAALQSGFYQSMASVYTDPNLLPEQQDFSYWIQKEQMDLSMGDAAGGSGSLSGGFQVPTAGDPYKSTDTYRGTSSPTEGPNAGLEPYSVYDPINKTTSVGYR